MTPLANVVPLRVGALLPRSAALRAALSCRRPNTVCHHPWHESSKRPHYSGSAAEVFGGVAKGVISGKNSKPSNDESVKHSDVKAVSDVNNNRKEHGIELLGSLAWKVAEQLSKRPKIGVIYKAIAAHRESTVKRLKDLCSKEPTIDVGIEMADAASLLKLMNSSTSEIESAGQTAHRGAMLLHQAEILRKDGQDLISKSQDLLRDTLNDEIRARFKI